MLTQYLYRLLILVPAVRQAALNTWWKANIDASGDTFTVGLNASGIDADAPTYYWACMSLTAAEFKKVMARLCNVAGITPPADWDAKNRDGKRDWLR